MGWISAAGWISTATSSILLVDSSNSRIEHGMENYETADCPFYNVNTSRQFPRTHSYSTSTRAFTGGRKDAVH